MSQKTRLVIGLLAIGAISGAVAFWGRTWVRPAAPPPAAERRSLTGPIVVAVTGDVLIRDSGAFRASESADEAGVAKLLENADAAFANLEINLLDEEEAQTARAQNLVRWPFGGGDDADALRALGVNVVSLANNHVGDYGRQGMEQTVRILRDRGLTPVGWGADLADATAPVELGERGRRVAVIAVASSSADEARATNTRGEIKARPGLSPLRFTTNVTVDPATFDALKLSPGATLAAGSNDTLVMSGRTIHRGVQTSIQFEPDERDVAGIVEQIERARATADVVVVSVHSHEPNNQSEEPASFMQSFAHSAIDHGALLVVGHGPHRLRGVERYKNGVILYSLGNFVFQHDGLDPRAADVYESGADLYSRAIGADDGRGGSTSGDDSWFQGAVMVATEQGGRLKSLRIHPLDLEARTKDGPRGVPRIARGERAAAILGSLARLSSTFGTRITVENEIGIVDMTSAR